MDNLYDKIKSNKFIIAGPCVLEDYNTSLMIAEFVDTVC